MDVGPSTVTNVPLRWGMLIVGGVGSCACVEVGGVWEICAFY